MGMIDIENVTYSYPHSTKPVIKDFSARFERGEITIVKGKNGCGKTTLTKLIAGILRPSVGRVLIDGRDISDMDLFAIGKQVGYVFQNPNRQLFCDTVYNEVAYGLRNLKKDEAEIMREVNSSLELFKLSQYHETYSGKLSLGEKQRVALAAVFALGTNYLVLDEPGTGLDARRQQELGSMLNTLQTEQNRGIIIVTHSSGPIERYAGRELVMSQ